MCSNKYNNVVNTRTNKLNGYKRLGADPKCTSKCLKSASLVIKSFQFFLYLKTISISIIKSFNFYLQVEIIFEKKSNVSFKKLKSNSNIS